MNLLDAEKFSAAPLQSLFETEKKGGAQIVFAAVVRGQGETQGFHERRIHVPERLKPVFMRKSASADLARVARDRVSDVATAVSKALRPALFALYQAAPEKLDFKIRRQKLRPRSSSPSSSARLTRTSSNTYSRRSLTRSAPRRLRPAASAGSRISSGRELRMRSPPPRPARPGAACAAIVRVPQQRACSTAQSSMHSRIFKAKACGMNDEIDFEAPEPSSGQSSNKKSLLERIATELWRLNEAQATGELAALRRMDHHSAPPAAFYRIMARAGATEMGVDAVRRWARAVAIMAQRPDALRASGLGEALKAIGVSEQRLDMLLYSRGPALHDLARRTAVRIARSHEFLPYRDLCQLVLCDLRPEDADDVRIRVAQSYLRAKDNAPSPAPAT